MTLHTEPGGISRQKGAYMGRWKYAWRVEYYKNGQWLEREVVDAKTSTDAVKMVRDNVERTGGRITEIKCCVRTDRW